MHAGVVAGWWNVISPARACGYIWAVSNGIRRLNAILFASIANLSKICPGIPKTIFTL